MYQLRSISTKYFKLIIQCWTHTLWLMAWYLVTFLDSTSQSRTHKHFVMNFWLDLKGIFDIHIQKFIVTGCRYNDDHDKDGDDDVIAERNIFVTNSTNSNRVLTIFLIYYYHCNNNNHFSSLCTFMSFYFFFSTFSVSLTYLQTTTKKNRKKHKKFLPTVIKWFNNCCVEVNVCTFFVFT